MYTNNFRYTLLLFLFEYRAATLLIRSQFPGPSAASIAKFEVDGDVISLDGHDVPLRTESETDNRGRIHVRIRRSTSSAPDSALSSSKGIATPTPSILSNADIFSARTPPHAAASGPGHDVGFGYSYGSPRLSGYASSDAYSLQPTPRASNFNELEAVAATRSPPIWWRSPVASGKVHRQSSTGVYLGGEGRGCEDITMPGTYVYIVLCWHLALFQVHFWYGLRFC